MIAVPFSMEAYGGLGECHGLIKDEGEHVSIEFQTQDAVAGVLKSEIQCVRIPLDDLVSIQLTKGWLGTSWLGVKIIIQTASLDVIEGIPGTSQGRIELSIARKDVATAEQFIEEFHDPQ